MSERMSVLFNLTRLFPVVCNSWLSASSACFLREGDTITCLDGGFFGRFVDYTLVGVEVETHCQGRRAFPVLVCRDQAGAMHRIYQNQPKQVRSDDVARGQCCFDGWAVLGGAEYAQPAPQGVEQDQ